MRDGKEGRTEGGRANAKSAGGGKKIGKKQVFFFLIIEGGGGVPMQRLSLQVSLLGHNKMMSMMMRGEGDFVACKL